ncbi:MAG: hypothetical protein ACI4VX_00625, partial [Succinivibrionaceae bacterium]
PNRGETLNIAMITLFFESTKPYCITLIYINLSVACRDNIRELQEIRKSGFQEAVHFTLMDI